MTHSCENRSKSNKNSRTSVRVSHARKHHAPWVSSDRLPTKPRLLVWNTDPSDESGEHWIAVYVDDDEHYGEYFDSLGRAPTRTFERYMDEHCREWIYNRKQLQSIVSRFCGHYCACFCILRSKGVDMCRFLRYFTRDTGLNDVIVHELICNV